MTVKKEGKPNLLLRQARDAHKLTQQELADKLGTTALNVGRWEGGKTFPNPYFRRMLCEFFNKSDEELGLIREFYHIVEDVEETNHTQSEPGLQQDETQEVNHTQLAPNLQHESKVTSKGYFRRWPLLIALGLAACFVVIGRSSSAFVQTAPPNRMMGLLIYHHQISKMGSYETYINALAWSSDSSYLACAIGDHTVRIVQPGTEEEVTVFHGHTHNVNSVVWLPNGRQVASASSDKTVQIWDAFTGRTTMTFSSIASVWAVAVSPDGNKIAWAGKDGITQVWSIAPQAHLLTYNRQAASGGIWGLAFSHDGKLIAAGDNTGDIQVFDVKNGETVMNYKEHTNTIYGLNWSPDDRYIASASGDEAGSNGMIRVWNTSSGKTVYVHQYHMVAMQSVSWSLDGNRIASSSADGTVQVWDAFTGNNLFIYHHHSGKVYTVTWSPDGNKIASGDANGDIQVWSAK